MADAFRWAGADPARIDITFVSPQMAEIRLDGEKCLGFPRSVLETRGIEPGTYERPEGLAHPHLAWLIDGPPPPAPFTLLPGGRG